MKKPNPTNEKLRTEMKRRNGNSQTTLERTEQKQQQWEKATKFHDENTLAQEKPIKQITQEKPLTKPVAIAQKKKPQHLIPWWETKPGSSGSKAEEGTSQEILLPRLLLQRETDSCTESHHRGVQPPVGPQEGMRGQELPPMREIGQRAT